MEQTKFLLDGRLRRGALVAQSAPDLEVGEGAEGRHRRAVRSPRAQRLGDERVERRVELVDRLADGRNLRLLAPCHRDAVGATPGEAYQALDWGEAWPFHSESMTAYGEQRYADALEAVRGGLEHMPDHAGLHYNYACFATLAGETGDETFGHLRRSVELFPSFREQARRDDDFAAVRHDPRFEEALR